MLLTKLLCRITLFLDQFLKSKGLISARLSFVHSLRTVDLPACVALTLSFLKLSLGQPLRVSG